MRVEGDGEHALVPRVFSLNLVNDPNECVGQEDGWIPGYIASPLKPKYHPSLGYTWIQIHTRTHMGKNLFIVAQKDFDAFLEVFNY